MLKNTFACVNTCGPNAMEIPLHRFERERENIIIINKIK